MAQVWHWQLLSVGGGGGGVLGIIYVVSGLGEWVWFCIIIIALFVNHLFNEVILRDFWRLSDSATLQQVMVWLIENAPSLPWDLWLIESWNISGFAVYNRY